VCKERWFLVLTLLLIVGGTLTGATNGMPVIVSHHHPPVAGIHVTDGLYSAFLNTAWCMVPFYLGWALFRKEDGFVQMLRAFVVAALLYVPFVLFELRMSPNLHLWIYGFAQHDFIQTIREGGYRPMVFMIHGLALARFLLVGMSAAFILGRNGHRIFGLPASVLGWTLLVVLILCKSVGALILAIVALLLLKWSSPKLQARTALLLAAVVALYPLLRTWDLVPTEQILSILRSLVGSERTGSLQFRFFNENLLLEKARQHFLFGWGQYGRNFVHYDWDIAAIADGYWIGQLGILGVVGFIATFGPMLIPLMLVPRRLKAIQWESHRRLIGGTALCLGLVALDFIPNGLFTSYPYFLVGALAGATLEFAAAEQQQAATAWVSV
jgi:hypothetical protein